jgi:hypothetical protein
VIRNLIFLHSFFFFKSFTQNNTLTNTPIHGVLVLATLLLCVWHALKFLSKTSKLRKNPRKMRLIKKIFSFSLPNKNIDSLHKFTCCCCRIFHMNFWLHVECMENVCCFSWFFGQFSNKIHRKCFENYSELVFPTKGFPNQHSNMYVEPNFECFSG